MLNSINANNFLFKRFDTDQKIVIWQVIAAIIFSVLFVLAAYYIVTLRLLTLDTAEQRLIFALRCQIFPVLMLFAGFVVVANSRFMSPAINPLAGAESEKMRVHLRYLSNTLEQFVLFFVTNLVLSTFLNSQNIKIIPILAALFVLVRITFWIGYLKNPLYRGFGLGLTAYPTAIVLFYDAYRVLGLLW